jgi:hypothetical protein
MLVILKLTMLKHYSFLDESIALNHAGMAIKE